MRKMKKIITLAMTLVMMMAMSLTAFAAPDAAANKATVSVINLQKPVANEDGTTTDGATVEIYKLATVSEDNKVVVENWAEKVYKLEANLVDGKPAKEIQKPALTPDQIKAIETAFGKVTDEAKATLKAGTAKADKDGKVSFSLDAGVYYIVATGSKAVYAPMVAVAIKNDGNGNYVFDNAEVKAKGTENDIEKTVTDKDFEFVHAGQKLTFQITKSIPRDASKFIVFDQTQNLSSLKNVDATVEYANEKATYKFKETDTTGLFKLDLTDIVYKNDAFVNTYAGEKLTITYKATVLGDQGYSNTPKFQVNDYDVIEGTPVKGFTGDITLAKKNNTDALLEGAQFNVYKKTVADGKTTLSDKYIFVVKPDETMTVDNETVTVKVYKLAEAGDQKTTDTIVATNGLVKVTGLDEGTYHFDEIVAPDGYSINPEGKDITITPNEEKLYFVHASDELIDTQLISLPFTGGMGTTIFTILGVAIMAMAAALFFATKKSR